MEDLSARWNCAVALFPGHVARCSQRLTLNYGLGWSIDGNLNHDLSKPALLAPILGTGGLGPTRKELDRTFRPCSDWPGRPRPDGKTVIRAGSGPLTMHLWVSPVLGRRACGAGSAWSRAPDFLRELDSQSLAGIPGVPVGTPLNFPAVRLYSRALT